MNGNNQNENPNTGNPQDSRMAKGGRLIFGIFMVLVYMAVGFLFIFNVFNIDNTTISCIVGGILIAYGFWRGYRLYRGGY